MASKSCVDLWLVVRPRDQVAARDVDVVGRLIDTAIGGNASSTGPLGPSIAVIRIVLSGRQHDDVVAEAHHTAGDSACVAAVVGVLAGLRPDHVLHREPYVDEVAVAGDVDLFEVAQQRRALVPRGDVRTW